MAVYLFYRDYTRGEKSAQERRRKMHPSLITIFVKAKELNKLVPVRLLAKYDLQYITLFELEDAYLILTKRSKSEGLLLKLTLKSYQYFKQK